MLIKNLKSYTRQKYLKYIFSKRNIIGKNVVFSKDTIIHGPGVIIGDNSVIGEQVILDKGVQIGHCVRLSHISVKENSIIETGVICTGFGEGKIYVGKESYIGLRNILDWSNDISIGNYVHIAGPSSGLWTHSTVEMCLNSIPLSKKDNKNFRPTAPINIENNVYVGGNCTIYPGITIHHNSVILPNSAVTKDVPPFSMVGGVPACVIKTLK